MQDWRQTVLSQFQDRPVLIELLHFINEAIDPNQDIQNFYEQVWNVNTATAYGLDVWGRIVDVSRYVNMSSDIVLGFASDAYPFNDGTWYRGVSASNNFRLSDDAYRLLILAKAATNISDCAIPSLNKILSLLFPGRGRAYVVDTGGMKFTYKFEFPLTDVEIGVIIQSGVLPRPAGVKVIYDYFTGE